MDYSAFHWSEKARKYAETVGTIFNVKGRVNTVQDLPSTGNKVGDLYLVGLTTDPDLIEYAWLSFDNVTRWEKLGSTATSLAFSAITGSPNDNTALKNALDGKYSTSNPNGYISGITSSMVTTALGYTPYNSSNPSGYISGITSAMVTTALGYTPQQQLVSGTNIKTINGNSLLGSGNLALSSFKLFHHDWFDYQLNDQSWLRADTFSWQDGTVYSNAYNHLVDDLGALLSTTPYYAWHNDEGVGGVYELYTTSETPTTGDYVYISLNGVIDTSSPMPAITSVPDSTHFVLGGKTWTRNSTYDISIKGFSNSTRYIEHIGSYYIEYYLSSDGHKIILPDMETTASNIYSQSGVAWYYILDTTNQRFKLPRKKYGFVGLRDTVGKYVPESYKQDKICGFVYNADAQPTSVTKLNQNVFLNFVTNNDWSYASIKSSDPVQQRSTQMYLYFYVGQFSQSATEQTAGLNTELFNGKVDLNAANLSTAGKSLISGLGMPTNAIENLTLGASGATYIAPANGYFVFSKTASASGQYIWLQVIGQDGTIEYDSALYSSTSSGVLRTSVPVQKGHSVQASYTAGGSTIWFRFVYAKGEQNV